MAVAEGGAWRSRRAVVAGLSIAWVALILACVTLLVALWRVDLSLAYVADSTGRDTDGIYRLAALWGGMDGSLLFWTTLQLSCSRRRGSTSPAPAVRGVPERPKNRMTRSVRTNSSRICSHRSFTASGAAAGSGTWARRRL